MASSNKLTAKKSNLQLLPRPEPMPDMRTYLSEREKALTMSKLRRQNYNRYLQSRRDCAIVDYLPIKLDIENVSRCNYRCIMCQVSDWHKGKRAEDMQFSDFKKLIDDQYGLVEIKLQGMGEPLFQGKTYFKMIQYARAQHIWVRSVTNASMLHLKGYYKKLVDAGVNEIQISVDGANKEVFEEIRRGSVFHMVMNNCKLINSYCQSNDLERTKMWTMVQRVNRHQLPDIVDLAAELGFTSMVFSLDFTAWGQKNWQELIGAINVDDSFTVDEGNALIERGNKNGVKVTFWQISAKYDNDTLCPWPFERAFVSSDMRVVPCCTIANPDVTEMGDAHNFSKVWHSERMVEFRIAHIEGNIPVFCQECYRV